MIDLHLPWLEASIVISLVGAFCISCIRDSDVARKWSLVFSGLGLVSTVGGWIDFWLLHEQLHVNEVDDRWHLMSTIFGREYLIMDQLSAPLLPLVALLYFLTILATLRTKIRRFSFSLTLLSEALILATLSCRETWLVACLMALSTIPPGLELWARRKPTRVYVLHMGLFIALLCIGCYLVQQETVRGVQFHSVWAMLPLLLAVLIRSGMAPFHCWMTDLYEHATFGTALLFTTPIPGAYAAIRLVLPIAPDWVLRLLGLLALFTALYAAGMALVQTEARRYYCYLLLSHAALVLVGLEIVTPISLTGALCVWLSVSVAMAGFGLTLRAIEARCGRLALTQFRGLYEHTPALAICFLLTGLAAVGFPGTFGFVGTELLIDGAVEAYPYIGVAVIISAALNGIGMVQTYFRLFTGVRYSSTVSLQISPRERFAVLLLAALILFGGLFPQSNLTARHSAASELLRDRQAISGSPPPTPSHGDHGHKDHDDVDSDHDDTDADDADDDHHHGLQYHDDDQDE